MPTAAHAPLAVAATAGYGWLDTPRNIDEGHRLFGGLAAAYSPLPELSLGAEFIGRRDTDPLAPDSPNLYGEPRLSARYSWQASSTWFLGGELNTRFIGADAPSIKLAATSPSLVGMAALKAAPRTFLAANLGFNLDRSAQAVPNPEVLTQTDKRSLMASSWNSIPWGVGVSHRLPSRTELVGELSGEMLLGSGAPGIGQSPSVATALARHPVSESLTVQGGVYLSLSSRPSQMNPEDLIPMLPRLGISLGIVWRMNPPKPPPAPSKPAPEVVAPPPTPEPAVPEVITSDVTGTIVDEGGRPLSDVEISLTQEGQAPRVERSYADGSFKFPAVQEGKIELRVATPGFEQQILSIGKSEKRTREIMLRPAVPAGQVRGKVLDLQGKPIPAKITVTPGDHVVTAAPDGSFDLELSPGSYTVKFEHQDFSAQRRRIQVQNRGVVILNIALTR